MLHKQPCRLRRTWIFQATRNPRRLRATNRIPLGMANRQFAVLEAPVSAGIVLRAPAISARADPFRTRHVREWNGFIPWTCVPLQFKSRSRYVGRPEILFSQCSAAICGVLGNFLDSLIVFFKTRHQTDLNQAESFTPPGSSPFSEPVESNNLNAAEK
jgi:hypothetical protein